jgi:hypothetical protein
VAGAGGKAVAADRGSFTLTSPTVIVVQRVLTTWEVGIVRQRLLQACSVTVLGVALAVAPMAAASASSHKAKHHPKAKHHSTTTTKPKSAKGLAPGSSLCVAVYSAEKNSANLGASIEKAMIQGAQSNNFATAQQAMLAAFSTTQKEEGAALSALKSAPANVQSAMKGLFTFVGGYETAIKNATSFTQLESSLISLPGESTAEADGVTVSNYVTQQCGTVTTTT